MTCATAHKTREVRAGEATAADAAAEAGREVADTEDIAAACAYLVSEEASFVTGQVLSPNGGAHL